MASNSGNDAILTLSRGITIRPYRHSDAERAAQLCNNSRISRNMRNTFPMPYTLDAAHEWIVRTKNKDTWMKPGTAWPPAAETKAVPNNYAVAVNDELVGSVGLIQGKDVEIRTAELGYWIAEEYWGQGIATEVVKSFLDWAFNTFGWLVRVFANVFEWNPSSMKVAEKAGLKYESVKKGAIFKEGQVLSLTVYARVRSEFM